MLRHIPFRGLASKWPGTIRCMCSSSKKTEPPKVQDPDQLKADEGIKQPDQQQSPSTTAKNTDAQTIDKRDLRPPPPEHPISRTINILKRDVKSLPRVFGFKTDDDGYIFPTHCDVVIIGGGAIGSSIAFWLKEKAREGLRVVVVEKDKTVSFDGLIFIHFQIVDVCLFFF